jgi:hypothetical protein
MARNCDFCRLAAAVSAAHDDSVARLLDLDGILIAARPDPVTGTWTPTGKPAPKGDERDAVERMRRDEVLRGNAVYDLFRTMEAIRRGHSH